MSLVVARIKDGRIAIASDTLLTEHDSPLPRQHGTIKSCMLPGDICVSFSNSPDLAEREFKRFSDKYNNGAEFAEVISFFEKSSEDTENDYIIAFFDTPFHFPMIVKIANGKRQHSSLKTLWIGDQEAYAKFREYETKKRQSNEHGRAINAVLFVDEPKNSPASDLYSAMRNLVASGASPCVGGFVSVISSLDNGFRFSVYSDMLFDWPEGKTEEYEFSLDDPITLVASNENAGYSIAQITPLYIGVNLVAFYFVKAKKLFLFYGRDNGLARNCCVFDDIAAENVRLKLNEFVGYDMKWLATITSAPDFRYSVGIQTVDGVSKDAKGVRMPFFVNANTFPKK
jgi:hypothetical protein